MSTELAMTALLALVFGLAIGLAHFGALGLVVARFGEGRMLAAARLQIARLALLAAAFVATARFGAFPLLACLAGLLLARWLVLRRARSGT